MIIKSLKTSDLKYLKWSRRKKYALFMKNQNKDDRGRVLITNSASYETAEPHFSRAERKSIKVAFLT